MQEIPAAQVVGVSFDVIGGVLANRLRFLWKQFDLELSDDRVRDLILNRKDIGQITVKAIGPQVSAVLSAG